MKKETKIMSVCAIVARPQAQIDAAQGVDLHLAGAVHLAQRVGLQNRERSTLATHYDVPAADGTNGSNTAATA